MPLPDSIQHLIENFAANRSEYHKGHYNETQTRVDYVNPLFAALGWDMKNRECGVPHFMYQLRSECF